MHKFHSFVLLVACLLLAVSSGATETEPLVVSVYEDISATQRLSQVQQQPFVPSGNTIAKGYSQSAFWLKVEMPPHAQQRYLRVRPSYLDNVTLYLPADPRNSDWHALHSGDQIPMVDRAVWTNSLMFPLPASQKPQTLYLRLKTSSTSLLNIGVLSSHDLQRQELLSALGPLISVAIMAAILIWASLDYWANRQRLVGMFVLVQITQIAFVLAISGFIPLLWPTLTWADTLTSLIVALTIALTLLFHRLLITEFEPSRAACWSLTMLVGAGFLTIGLVLSGVPQLAMQIGSSAVLALIPVLLWLAISSRRDALPGLMTLRVTYSSLALILVFVMAPIFGFSVSFDFYLWATTTQGLLTGLVIAAFLAKRSLALRHQQLDSQFELARVQESLLHEKQRVEDQAQFLDMLAHELKTPLGVISLTLESVSLSQIQQQRLSRSLQTMSAVIDRCRLSLQMEEGELKPHLEAVDLQREIRDATCLFDQASRFKLATSNCKSAYTDQQLLAVILHNLFDNALKYSVPESEIDVCCQTDMRFSRPGFSIKVSNQIAADLGHNAEQMFGKYFRGKASSGVTGSGLGLSLSRGVANLLSGELTALFQADRVEVQLWLPV